METEEEEEEEGEERGREFVLLEEKEDPDGPCSPLASAWLPRLRMTSPAKTCDVILSECMVLLLLEDASEVARSERRWLEHRVSDGVSGSAEEDREPSSISGMAALHISPLLHLALFLVFFLAFF